MVERRKLQNTPGRDLFEKVLVFHNQKHDSCIILFGVTEEGNYFGARMGFYDTAILSTNVVEFEPETFWKLVAFPEVVEIDPTMLPGLKTVGGIGAASTFKS